MPTGMVANGRCSQVTLAIAGAVAGQAVILAALGPLQNGVTIEASRVAAANQVTINVCNLSGTTMTAIVDLPIRVVTFG